MLQIIVANLSVVQTVNLDPYTFGMNSGNNTTAATLSHQVCCSCTGHEVILLYKTLPFIKTLFLDGYI